LSTSSVFDVDINVMETNRRFESRVERFIGYASFSGVGDSTVKIHAFSKNNLKCPLARGYPKKT
jgi:hypothetical protein